MSGVPDQNGFIVEIYHSVLEPSIYANTYIKIYRWCVLSSGISVNMSFCEVQSPIHGAFLKFSFIGFISAILLCILNVRSLLLPNNIKMRVCVCACSHMCMCV